MEAMTETILNYPIRSNKLSVNVEIREHVLHRKTDFQTIDIYDTEAFGKILFLDNHVQLAELDEHAYHESLVHIPLLSVFMPRRALVIGGGDGAVLRELCRHSSLQNIDIVEIDGGVVEATRSAMPSLSNGAFDDPRVTLYLEDAFGFVKNVTDPYDLIVMDVTDTYEDEEGELSEQLFTPDFHRDCYDALSAKGILVSQADNHIFCPYSLEEVLKTFNGLFEKTGWYQALVPSFGGFSAFAWGSKGGEVSATWPGASFDLRYLNETTWALAFNDLGFRLS